jgi:dethiobiotin synthetase
MSEPQILFVTGTDTGVGKTVTSAVLAARAREADKRVRYVKPVQTGLAPGAPGSDADFVAARANVETFELLRFEEPLAPAIAAARAGAPIDFDLLVKQIGELRPDCDLLLVEGAGGLLAPLTDDHTMADLARVLEAPLVVVARPGLGTLNHTALTLEAAARRTLSIDRLIISDWPANPAAVEETNFDHFSRLDIPVEVIPHAPYLVS